MADVPPAAGRLRSLLLPRFWAIFFPLALLGGAVVWALYEQDSAAEYRLHEQAGAHLVGLHADIISRELKVSEADLLYLADQTILRKYLSGAPGGKQELQDEYLLFSRRRAVYDQIRYLDADGRERIRVNYNDGRPDAVPETALQNKSDRSYFWRTIRLARGQVFLSPFDLNVEHGKIERPLKPTIRLATPVFDGERVRGILVLNTLGAGMLGKLAAVSATFPGSVWLLNRDGYYLRGPSPQDEWGFVLGHGRGFATQHPDPWGRMTHAEGGQLLTADGLFTFRALAPRAELPPAQKGRPSDPDDGDPRLTVVSYIPADVLNGRPLQMLRRLLFLYAVLLVVIFGLAWYLAYAGAVRQQQERRLAESEARLRSLSTKLLTAQEDERRSLSRDVHDELGQLVTSVTLDLQRARQVTDVHKKDELAGRALRGAESLLDRIHEISARIRPALLDDLGLRDAVQNLLSEFERRTGVVPRAELHFERQDIPPVISDNVYRILQEALTNVSRHAQAAEVVVGLHADEHGLTLTVRDAGAGFKPEHVDGKRLGLLGMRERAELLDGTFTVRAAPGQGTELQIRIPFTHVPQAEPEVRPSAR
jgi:signal transduction histidine kinase